MVALCSDQCTSQAQQEVQANAAEVRVGNHGEERDALLRRNAQLMEAMLDRQRQAGGLRADDRPRSASADGSGRASTEA